MYCRIRAKPVEAPFPSTKPISLGIFRVVSSAIQELLQQSCSVGETVDIKGARRIGKEVVRIHGANAQKQSGRGPFFRHGAQPFLQGHIPL